LASFRSINDKKFYYAFDEKIYLILTENKMLVRYNDGFDKNKEELVLTNFSSNMGIKWRNNTMVEITTPSGKKKDELKTFLEARKDVSTCQQSYKLENGLDISLFDEIVLQFLPGVSKEQQEELNQRFKTEVIATYEIFQILKVSKGTDALDIANKYFESGLVKFSKPNFLSNFEPFQVMPNDTYFNMQITCHNTGQVFTDGHSGTNDADIDAPAAWALTTGSNDIIVAVIDEGVTSDHPDLPNTRQLRLAGSDFVDGDANPSPTGNNNHGNACAGVIAATMNNNQGIAGIAPNCRIMPIRISYDSSSVADFALAIRFAANNGAHVISNSWGLRDPDPLSSPPYSPNLYPEVVTAIQYAVSSGRNGNGCVVAFAAGNTANNAAGNNGYISFPANVTISGVITVGASDRNDNQANYSPTSNPSHSYNQIIDIVAPSHRAYPNQIAGETYEMWSIDIPNNAGYNPWPGIVIPPTTGEILPNTGTNNLAYTARFGGTSHACPVVAGVAALMLSINPNLTQQQVFDILTTNADQVGGYTYTNGRSNELGSGRLNACRAVSQVLPTVATLSGPSVVCSSGATFTVNNAAGSTISWTCSTNISFDHQTGNNKVFTANGTGTGTIQATLISACGNVTLPAKTVWVGLPVITSISGPSSVSINQPASFTAQLSLDSYPDSYSWTTSPSSGVTIYPDGRYASMSFANSGTYQVVARAHNSYGWSDYFITYIDVPDGYYLSISPNPTTTEATIELVGTSTEKVTKETEWDLEVYDAMQTMKAKVQKIKGNKQTLNTSGWKEGVYIVRAIIGKDVISGKLVVKP
jgi:subtilisin family serine protease